MSNAETDELCDELVRQYLGHDALVPPFVDLDGFVRDYLKCTVFYEAFAEEDPDIIGFTSDGVHPLKIFKDGRKLAVFYERNVIVLDRMLLRPGEENRRRFTPGHEVGHILLNRINGHADTASFERVYDWEQNYTASALKARYTIEETQANNLSAALPMPRFMVLNTLKRFNDGRRLPVYGDNLFRTREKVIISKMADSLRVSCAALVIRLRGLRLLVRHDAKLISTELHLEVTS